MLKKIVTLSIFSSALLGCSSDLKGGHYSFQSRAIKGVEKCEVYSGWCITLEEYKTLCDKIFSITQGMADSIRGNYASPKFSALIKGGKIESVSGEWLDKNRFNKDSGILGVCQVSKVVSGNYNGTSSREKMEIFAQEFMISEGEILLHRGNMSAWMM